MGEFQPENEGQVLTEYTLEVCLLSYLHTDPCCSLLLVLKTSNWNCNLPYNACLKSKEKSLSVIKVATWIYSYLAPSAYRNVEAAEVRSHVDKLFEQYSYMLRLQVK